MTSIVLCGRCGDGDCPRICNTMTGGDSSWIIADIACSLRALAKPCFCGVDSKIVDGDGGAKREIVRYVDSAGCPRHDRPGGVHGAAGVVG